MIYCLIEFLNELIGIGAAMWIIFAGPIALFIGLPRNYKAVQP